MRYWIIQNRESKGPYTIAQLRSMWHSGAITGDTLYCAEGSNVWLTLEARAPELEQPRQARMQSADDDLLYQDATSRNYGGFWIRVGTYFVDFVVMLIPTLLISLLYRSVAQPTTDAERMFVDIMDGFVISSIVWWVYEAVLTSSPLQGTVGKKACGLKVVDYEGQRISFARATGRYFAKFLSSTLFAIGIIMVGWTVRKQGLHDFMAKTLVIRDRK